MSAAPRAEPTMTSRSGSHSFQELTTLMPVTGKGLLGLDGPTHVIFYRIFAGYEADFGPPRCFA
jgi:hypothetical protein